MAGVILFDHLGLRFDVGIMIDSIGMFADANAIIFALEIASNALTLADAFDSEGGFMLSLTALMLKRIVQSLRCGVLGRVVVPGETAGRRSFEGR
jgi:hypothetical protein